MSENITLQMPVYIYQLSQQALFQIMGGNNNKITTACYEHFHQQ